MPGYALRSLRQFQHPLPDDFTMSAHPYVVPVYGKKVQLAQQESTAPKLSEPDTLRVRQVVGRFLFYARAIDSNLLMALNTIATQQENATERTAMLVTHMLNYCATFPDAILTYDASDMILHIQSDASFLSEPKAKSRGGGYLYLSNNTESPTDAQHNGPIYCFCQVLKNILSSAAEAETSAMFKNVMQGIIIRTILADLNRKQPPTPIRMDNSTAWGL